MANAANPMKPSALYLPATDATDELDIANADVAALRCEEWEAKAELERVLYEHDAVLEAAVVGRPDERWGEVPVAYVVVRPGATVTAGELVRHCRTRLARFKVPKEIAFLEALPRNPSGKVLKRELRGAP